MLPHNTQGLGWYKAESRVIVRMSEDYDNAIRGVAAGSEPSFYELRTNTSTLIGWEDYQWCQSQGGSRGGLRGHCHRAEGNVAAGRAQRRQAAIQVCRVRVRSACGRREGMRRAMPPVRL